MDPAQFQLTYNDNPLEYLTPYSHYQYHEFVPQTDHYQPCSETYSYEGFRQTPSLIHSQSYVQTGDDLAAAAASMNLHSPAAALSPASPPLTSPRPPSEPDVVSVSTAFHPNAHPHLPPPDTILSSDAALFYVHSPTLLSACPGLFTSSSSHSILPLSAPLSHPKWRNTPITLHAPAAEVNIIIHALYGFSSAAYLPSFETLANAIDRMPEWGVIPSTHITPSTPLYTLLLSLAPLHPLDLYGLAAYHGLHTLAVATSSHLLSYSLSSITDTQAERLGAFYLKKLFLLHVERGVALKKILLKPPHPHPSSKTCGFGEQNRLTRAWALASAYLAWEARPDLSTNTMHSALNPLMEHLDCEQCHEVLRDRIKDVVVQWASVGYTPYTTGIVVQRSAQPATCFVLVYGRTPTAKVGVGPRELDLIEDEKEKWAERRIYANENANKNERLQLGVTVPCRSEGI